MSNSFFFFLFHFFFALTSVFGSDQDYPRYMSNRKMHILRTRMAPLDIIRSFSLRPSRPKLNATRRQRRRQKKIVEMNYYTIDRQKKREREIIE